MCFKVKNNSVLRIDKHVLLFMNVCVIGSTKAGGGCPMMAMCSIIAEEATL